MGATAITAIKNLIGRVWKNNRAARSYEQVCALCLSGFGPPLELDPRSKSASGYGPPGPYPLADLDPAPRIWTP